jgi:HKD family nuclease
MASASRINLMEEFESVVSDNDYILLTTYAFDPFFFDAFLLKALERNNIGSEISVIVDATQYFDSYTKFTSLTGRNYRLVPVFLNQGVFHPKVFLFFSEKRRKATMYIGSSNLTLQGFTNNAEVVAKFDYNLANGAGETLVSVLDVFSTLCTKGVLKDRNLVNLIADIRESSVVKNLAVVKEEFRFLHNVERPILEQLMSIVSGKKFDSLLIVAPFVSEGPNVLRELLTFMKLGKIVLCLQPGNHNVTDLSDITALCREKGVLLEVVDGHLRNPEERSRKFHSKILYFQGEEEFLLVGSPNFTVRALLRTIADGNLECALLYAGNRCRDVVSEIELETVADVNSLLRTASSLQFEEHGLRVKVYSANFDRITRTVSIETEPINIDADVILSIEQPNQTRASRHNLSSGKVQIRVNEGFPIEAVVTVGTQRTPVRIFQDKNYFMRRVARAASTLSEVSNTLFYDPTLDATDLITLMARLLEGVSTIELSQQPKKQEPSSRKIIVSKPPRDRQIGSIGGLLRTLAQVYEMLAVNRKRRQIEDQLVEEFETDRLPERPRYALERYEEHEEKRRLVIGIVRRLNGVLEVWSSRQEDMNSVLESRTILLHYYLKLFRPISDDEEVLELILRLLDEKLTEASLDSSRESKTKLFGYLVTLYYICKIHQNPGFVSDIFRYEDIVSLDTYTRTRKLSESMFAALGDNSFSGETFAWWYAKLARNCVTSRDATEKIVQCCADIDRQETSEYRNMLIHFLKNQKDRFSINEYIKQKIAALKFEKPSTVETIEKILGPFSRQDRLQLRP